MSKSPKKSGKSIRSEAQQEVARRGLENAREANAARRLGRQPASYNEPPAGLPEQYRLMLHVWRNGPGFDVTHEQKMMREFLKSNRAQFNLQLSQFEKESGKGGEGGKDVGTERAKELIAQLIAEFSQEGRE